MKLKEALEKLLKDFGGPDKNKYLPCWKEHTTEVLSLVSTGVEKAIAMKLAHKVVKMDRDKAFLALSEKMFEIQGMGV